MLDVLGILDALNDSLSRDHIRVRLFREYWLVEQWFRHSNKWVRFSRFIDASDAYRQALALQRNYLREVGASDAFELQDIQPVIETKPRTR